MKELERQKLQRQNTGSSPAYWLVVRSEGYDESDWSEAVTVDVYGSECALAVFSFREEADMFAGTLERGWCVRGLSNESLLALLRDCYRDTPRIALDPLPDPVGLDIVSLLSVSREYFAYNLLSQSQKDARCQGDVYRAS